VKASFTLSNGGGLPAGPFAVEITGKDSGDFALVENTCVGLLQPASSCGWGVRFRPTSAARRWPPSP
jgi:hypothetical protein